MSPGDS